MKLHLPIIIIPALLFTLSACKSEQDEAAAAWLKTATEQVEKVTALLKENDLSPKFDVSNPDSEPYYEVMKKDMNKLKAGPVRAEKKKALKDIKEFVKAFGGDAKDIKKEQDSYLPGWRQNMRTHIIENQKIFALNCDINSGRPAAIEKAEREVGSPEIEWLLTDRNAVRAKFNARMTEQGYVMNESKEWEPTDKTKAAYLKVHDYIWNVVIPAIEMKL
ncbi:MAG: hypothetical protein LBH03_02180 [Holophagales bacterium]|jgi:vancomycin resistance protein YoaR|nr:hypothetical protein [Holophagales bacterium]